MNIQAIILQIIREGGDNPIKALWYLFKFGGGLIFIPIMIQLAWKGWNFWIQEKFKHHVPHVMLKIDVPALNEQSMKAVEQIFVHLYGSKDYPNREERYWLGFTQEPFSFEIISDGGYITFYVYIPKYYREMVEAAFYAQYPDAVLTETEDYSRQLTEEMIMKDQIKIYGSELVLEKDDVYPIRSWPHWEHPLPGKAIDPLASILEMMSRLQPGEKWWLQIMAAPADPEHIKHKGQEAIMSVVEPDDHHHTGPGIFDKLLDIPIKLLGIIHDAIWPGEGGEEAHEAYTERQRLSDPEKELVQEVDRKMSRWTYETKIRWLYFASPELYDYKKGRRGMLGALSQYKFINSFKEGVRTRIYPGTLKFRKLFPDIRVKWKARKMMWAYQSRDMERGEHDGFLLSTEELSSIYHFPQLDVRAPFVAKSTSRGVEPPTQLRYASEAAAREALEARVTLEREPEPTKPPRPQPTSTAEPELPADNNQAPQPPSNLPFV